MSDNEMARVLEEFMAANSELFEGLIASEGPWKVTVEIPFEGRVVSVQIKSENYDTKAVTTEMCSVEVGEN